MKKESIDEYGDSSTRCVHTDIDITEMPERELQLNEFHQHAEANCNCEYPEKDLSGRIGSIGENIGERDTKTGVSNEMYVCTDGEQTERSELKNPAWERNDGIHKDECTHENHER